MEQLLVSQLVSKLPAFYGTRRFITMFKEANILAISWTRMSCEA